MWTIFKVFIEFVKILLLFYVLFCFAFFWLGKSQLYPIYCTHSKNTSLPKGKCEESQSCETCPVSSAQPAATLRPHGFHGSHRRLQAYLL